MQSTRHLIFQLTIFLFAISFANAFTKNGNTYETNGTQTDVTQAISDSKTGDVVKLPPGRFVWGTGGSSLIINKQVTLIGAGQNLTTIELASDAPSMTSGTVRISNSATIRDFTVKTPSTSGAPTAFSINSSEGWRITNVTYDNSTNHGYYFIYVGGGYGVIDTCQVITGSGSDEPIFIRGRSDSWQTPSSLGTDRAVYVEDCTFSGPGYVCDVNDNGRAVFRFNLIIGSNKIDAHGYASNSQRGVRHMEIYGNRWTGQAGFWRTIEIRGGTGTVFGNTCDNRGGVTVNYPSFHFIEYGCINKWPRFGNTYQTPVDYPIRDQVGVGMDPIRPASEPYYLWNNSQAGADYILSWVAIPTAAIEQNGGVSFSMQDIIKADRDYFKHTPGSSFNGSSGIGVGTGAQKNAIVATKEGVGFWVTDEGFWDKSSPAADGQLYTWSGSSWMLKYTPYTYPHPLRQESPAQQTPPAPSTLKILQGL